MRSCGKLWSGSLVILPCRQEKRRRIGCSKRLWRLRRRGPRAPACGSAVPGLPGTNGALTRWKARPSSCRSCRPRPLRPAGRPLILLPLPVAAPYQRPAVRLAFIHQRDFRLAQLAIAGDLGLLEGVHASFLPVVVGRFIREPWPAPMRGLMVVMLHSRLGVLLRTASNAPHCGHCSSVAPYGARQ